MEQEQEIISIENEFKKALTSKTVWVNLIAFIAFILQQKYGYVMPEDVQMELLAFLNIILRYYTHKKIQW